MKFLNQLGSIAVKNAPTILTGVAVSGAVSSCFLCVHSTPKALQIIQEQELTEPKEIVKATWKLYVPAAVTLALTIFCIISANSVNLRRQAALGSLASLTEASLQKYQQKVIEKIGEKKEQELRDEIAADEIKRLPYVTETVINTGKGSTLCLDPTSGRYFRSDIEFIRKTQNDLNQMIINQVFVSLNDLYAALGLSETMIGDYMGWNPDHLIDFDFTSQLTEEGEPCLVIMYMVEPRFDYRQYY